MTGMNERAAWWTRALLLALACFAVGPARPGHPLHAVLPYPAGTEPGLHRAVRWRLSLQRGVPPAMAIGDNPTAPSASARTRPLPRVEGLGVGAWLYNDRAGDSRLNTFHFSLGGSWTERFRGCNASMPLTGGLQPGITAISIDQADRASTPSTTPALLRPGPCHEREFARSALSHSGGARRCPLRLHPGTRAPIGGRVRALQPDHPGRASRVGPGPCWTPQRVPCDHAVPRGREAGRAAPWCSTWPRASSAS